AVPRRRARRGSRRVRQPRRSLFRPGGGNDAKRPTAAGRLYRSGGRGAAAQKQALDQLTAGGFSVFSKRQTGYKLGRECPSMDTGALMVITSRSSSASPNRLLPYARNAARR